MKTVANPEPVTVKYVLGLPTKTSVWALIEAYFGKGTFEIAPSGSYQYSGAIVWQRTMINEHVDGFVGYLESCGVSVFDYRLYNSPSVGCITIRKRETPKK